jgi:hypothetical protein
MEGFHQRVSNVTGWEVAKYHQRLLESDCGEGRVGVEYRCPEISQRNPGKTACKTRTGLGSAGREPSSAGKLCKPHSRSGSVQPSGSRARKEPQ